jgi:hypothetical protein
MGRRRNDVTDEERRAANRDRSRAWHEKIYARTGRKSWEKPAPPPPRPAPARTVNTRSDLQPPRGTIALACFTHR